MRSTVMQKGKKELVIVHGLWTVNRRSSDRLGISTLADLRKHFSIRWAV